MAERYYLDGPLAPGPVVLRGAEAHHLATVCRARPGDALCLFNGDGREYAAEVVAIDRKCVAVEIAAVTAPDREVGFRLEVAAPLPKGDRAAFLLEKLTELGVTDFVPLQTHRSVVHPRAAKLDKLQRAVIEASKQCGRNVLLRAHPLTAWADYLRDERLPTARFVAHVSDGSPERLPTASRADVALAVGPEGGFTDAEVERARAAGWRVVGLGPRVLRVETAALALACWANRAERSGVTA